MEHLMQSRNKVMHLIREQTWRKIYYNLFQKIHEEIAYKVKDVITNVNQNLYETIYWGNVNEKDLKLNSLHFQLIDQDDIHYIGTQNVKSFAQI
jgi:formate dehydrogenase maturation protein FdhE